MDKENGSNETLVQLTHQSLVPVKKLVCKLKKRTSVEKLNFLKKIKKTDLGLIIELVFNYIKGNIITEFDLHNKLKKNKEFLYNLISKTKTFLTKKKLLASERGVFVINILILLFSKTCKYIK